MLKKQIKCKDYNGQDVTVVAYFHLNKFEWLELETYTKGGLIENLKTALENGNAKKTIDILKKIILTAYGEKNEDTGKFEKSDKIAIDFSKTEAFSELFYDLAYNAASSEAFFTELIPQELRADVKQMMNVQKPVAVDSIDNHQDQ